MKKFILLSTVSAALAITSGCNTATESKAVSATKPSPSATASVTATPSKAVWTVKATSDFAKLYDSVESLAQDASIVIKGEVVSHEYFQNTGVTYTKSVVKVTKVIKGNVKTGDLLTFVERGGITTKGEIAKKKPGKVKLNAGEENDPVEVIFDGVKSMRKGETVLLFGKLDTNKALLPQDFYVILGGFQGKFKVNGDSVERTVANTDGDKGDGHSLSKLKMKLSELETKIKAVK